MENQSLPDLSKMDEHWEQMSLLLQPGSGAVDAGRYLVRNRVLLAIFGVVIIAVVYFLVFRNVNHREDSSVQIKELPNQTMVNVDTPLLIKAGKSDSTDTILGAMPVHSIEEPENKKLLLERFYEQIQKKPQAFIINNRRDTVIYGKEGTRLTIPANAFETKENITLLLTEFYSIDDMIRQKLTTRCDGHQLMTGGMIYLDARNKNEELVDLKKGALLRLDMPRPNADASMELFYGYDYYRNDITSVIDSINWSRTNQFFTNTDKNSVGLIQISPISRKFAKRDTAWITNKEKPNSPFRYFLKDTITGTRISDRKADSIATQRFGVNINRLGWINCDRFYNDSRPKVELIVDLGDNPDNFNTMLVFDKLASILPRSSRQGNTIRFSNLPEGEAARIVAFGIKNYKPVTAMKKLIISRTTVADLKFEEVNASAYQKKSSN